MRRFIINSRSPGQEDYAIAGAAENQERAAPHLSLDPPIK
jgi:hypothetical protein